MDFVRIRRASWLSAAGRAFLAVQDDVHVSPEAAAEATEEDEELPRRKRSKLVLHGEVKDEVHRSKLISSWLNVLLLNPEATSTGRFLAKRETGGQLEVLQEVLSAKATATLASRLTPVISMIKWLTVRRSQVGASDLSDYQWPPDEEAVFGFLKSTATALSPFFMSVTGAVEAVHCKDAASAAGSCKCGGVVRLT